MDDFSNKNNPESIIAVAHEMILKGKPFFALLEKVQLDLRTLSLDELFSFVSYCSYELGIARACKIMPKVTKP